MAAPAHFSQIMLELRLIENVVTSEKGAGIGHFDGLLLQHELDEASRYVIVEAQSNVDVSLL